MWLFFRVVTIVFAQAQSCMYSNFLRRIHSGGLVLVLEEFERMKIKNLRRLT